MGEPVYHVSFDPVGAAIILLVLLLGAAGLVFLTSRYWRRRLARTAPGAPSTEERRSELVLNSLPDGLALADSEGRVLWCNGEARRLLSLRDDSPRLAPELISAVERVAESQRPEFHEIGPTEDVRLQFRALPLAQSGSIPGSVLCVVSDVSERRHQEEFFRHFIHNISHELLIPLAAVSGHAANIREAGAEETESRELSLAIIEREVARLTALTSNLLVLSRLESEVPLHRERTNVGAVAEQAVTELLGLARDKDIDVSIQSASSLPRIQADRSRLKQVFVNLVENAIKHCPEGTKVQVRLRAESDTIIAEVEDDGPGIPAEDLPHIFEKLYRVQKDGTRAPEGSGLGLSIVKRIVELHGGDVTAESTVGQGTVFKVRLPADGGSLQ